MALEGGLLLDEGHLGGDGRTPALLGRPRIVVPAGLLAEDLTEVALILRWRRRQGCAAGEQGQAGGQQQGPQQAATATPPGPHAASRQRPPDPPGRPWADPPPGYRSSRPGG